MRNEAFYLVIGICGFMFGLISHTYSNLEYKGYSSASSCTGDCYVKYVEENGPVVEQLQAKAAEAASADLLPSREKVKRDESKASIIQTDRKNEEVVYTFSPPAPRADDKIQEKIN